MSTALICALESTSLVRNAVSLGGDADTLAAIAGAVGEALYGLPERLVRIARARYLDHAEDITAALDALYAHAMRCQHGDLNVRMGPCQERKPAWLSFEEAMEIFDGPVLSRRHHGERRERSYGLMQSVVVVCVVHTDSTARRIISARKATSKEREEFHACLTKAIG